MTTLTEILDSYRAIAKSEREKGTYFERLFMDYLTVEPAWKDLYEKVWMYADWAREQGVDARDSGIDLVARTMDGDFHAIQCKLYDRNYHLQKSDIDSFFTASGRKPFVHRIIVSTTNHWSIHAENALVDQQPPDNSGNISSDVTVFLQKKKEKGLMSFSMFCFFLNHI